MGISSLGIGSNLDLNALLDGMKQSQQERLKPIIKQKNDINAKVSAYGQLKSKLSAFNTATEALQKSDAFNNRTVTSSDSAFTATAKSGAEIGNYSIKIDQIASSHSIATREVNNKATILNSDNSHVITIKQNDGTTLDVKLTSEQKTLQDIANAINKAVMTNLDGKKTESPISAAIIHSSEEGYQLVLSSKETGEKNTITSVSSSDGTLNSIIGYDNNFPNSSSMTEKTIGQDARFSLNGIDITSTSNTISDVIKNIDITLKGTTSTTQQMTVEPNNEKTITAIKNWVDSFNQLKGLISAATKFTPADSGSTTQNQNNGPLIGDTVVRTLDNSIRSVLSSGQSGQFRVLSEIGIDMDINSGNLSLNESKLQETLDKNSYAVADLFMGDGKTTGIANQISSVATSYIESDGSIASAEKGLASTLKTLNKRYDQINSSIEQSIDRYRSQFNRLDTLSSQLGATSKYLSAQLGGAKG